MCVVVMIVMVLGRNSFTWVINVFMGVADNERIFVACNHENYYTVITLTIKTNSGNGEDKMK